MDHHSIGYLRTATDIIPRHPVAGPSADIAKAGGAGANDGVASLIGELELRRRMLGWSVADVAARCGIDAPTLNQWERGNGMPALDAAQRWSAALGLHFVLLPAMKEPRERLRIDWPARRVTVDGTPVRLTPMEWKALERLAQAPGQVVTHQALFRHLYGEERGYRAQSTAIRVLITKLRRLLPLRIEAQWGKGYILTGVAPSQPAATEPGAGTREAAGAEPVARSAGCDRTAPAIPPIVRPPAAASAGAGLAIVTEPKMQVAASSPRRAACRAEELGVIERFLAERGVTRCPDVATIERSPLPTLVWDKVKRKWVRPSPSNREAV